MAKCIIGIEGRIFRVADDIAQRLVRTDQWMYVTKTAFRIQQEHDAELEQAKHESSPRPQDED